MTVPLDNMIGDYAPARSNIFQMDKTLFFRNAAGETFPIAGVGIGEVIVIELNEQTAVAIPYRLYRQVERGAPPHVDVFDENGDLCYTKVSITTTQVNVYFGLPFTGVVVVRT